MLEYVSTFILNIIDLTGYIGIFFLTLLNALGIPIPSEIILPFSGFLTSVGTISFFGVIIVAIVGGFTGSVTGFLIGRKIGIVALDIISKLSLHNRNDFLKMEKWFSKFGPAVVAIGLCLPIVRSLVSVSAGVFGVRPRSFWPASAIGTTVWSVALVSLGYFLGENWSSMGVWFRKFDIIIILLIAVVLIAWIFRHLKRRKEKTNIN